MAACSNTMQEYFLQLGSHAVWGDDRPFILTPEARRRHLYVVGMTGAGKSTLLRNMILQDLVAGHGVAVLDPHGDLAEELLDYIPQRRINQVCYFNPNDVEFPIGLNLLQKVPDIERPRVASGIISLFKDIWHDSWPAPRMEYILYAAVAAVLECDDVSLMAVPRMLTDDDYRDWVVKQITDPMLKRYWLEEFTKMDRKAVNEAVSPILNKVGQFLLASPVRNIVGQVKSKINARDIMDSQQIFIANLSKGLLGEDKANLLGAMLVTQFKLAAMSRTDIPESQRKEFYLYIDEFQNFSSVGFASILSEARKYRLSLTIAHQYTSQAKDKVRDAVFGNVGTMISFRVGFDDAAILARQFGENFPPSRFVELPNFEAFVRPVTLHSYVSPYPVKAYPPIIIAGGKRERVIQESRQRFATPLSQVKKRIKSWIESTKYK